MLSFLKFMEMGWVFHWVGIRTLVKMEGLSVFLKPELRGGMESE